MIEYIIKRKEGQDTFVSLEGQGTHIFKKAEEAHSTLVLLKDNYNAYWKYFDVYQRPKTN